MPSPGHARRAAAFGEMAGRMTSDRLDVNAEIVKDEEDGQYRVRRLVSEQDGTLRVYWKRLQYSIDTVWKVRHQVVLCLFNLLLVAIAFLAVVVVAWTSIILYQQSHVPSTGDAVRAEEERTHTAHHSVPGQVSGEIIRLLDFEPKLHLDLSRTRENSPAMGPTAWERQACRPLTLNEQRRGQILVPPNDENELVDHMAVSLDDVIRANEAYMKENKELIVMMPKFWRHKGSSPLNGVDFSPCVITVRGDGTSHNNELTSYVGPIEIFCKSLPGISDDDEDACMLISNEIGNCNALYQVAIEHQENDLLPPGSIIDLPICREATLVITGPSKHSIMLQEKPAGVVEHYAANLAQGCANFRPAPRQPRANDEL